MQQMRRAIHHETSSNHAEEIGKAIERETGPTATPPTAAPVPPETQTNTSHEHLLCLLSKLGALPQPQTIEWIPRGLDRRCATIQLQALDCAMQAAKANTSVPIHRLWSNMALTPHLILRVAPGRKQQEEWDGQHQGRTQEAACSGGERRTGTTPEKSH